MPTALSTSCWATACFVQQRLVTIPRDLSQFEIGLRCIQGAARLRQLLIDLRRLNDGEQLSGLHMCADIEVPLLQIAIGAGVNRRRYERLHVAGQDDLRGRGSLLGRHDRNRRHSHLIRHSPKRGLSLHSRPDSKNQNQHRSQRLRAQVSASVEAICSRIRSSESVPQHLDLFMNFALRHIDSPMLSIQWLLFEQCVVFVCSHAAR